MIILWIVSGMKRSVHWPDLYCSACFNTFADVGVDFDAMGFSKAHNTGRCVNNARMRPWGNVGSKKIETGQVFRLSRQAG